MSEVNNFSQYTHSPEFQSTSPATCIVSLHLQISFWRPRLSRQGRLRKTPGPRDSAPGVATATRSLRRGSLSSPAPGGLQTRRGRDRPRLSSGSPFGFRPRTSSLQRSLRPPRRPPPHLVPSRRCKWLHSAAGSMTSTSGAAVCEGPRWRSCEPNLAEGTHVTAVSTTLSYWWRFRTHTRTQINRYKDTHIQTRPADHAFPEGATIPEPAIRSPKPAKSLGLSVA